MKRIKPLLLLPVLLLASCGRKPSGYDRVHFINMGKPYCCRLDECSSTSKGQYIKATMKNGIVGDEYFTFEGIFSQGTYVLVKEGARCPVCYSTEAEI